MKIVLKCILRCYDLEYLKLLLFQLYELTPVNRGCRGVEVTESKPVGFGRS